MNTHAKQHEQSQADSSLEGMRVVVAGGGGFIGTNLIRALLAQGANVVGYGRLPRFPAAIKDAKWVQGDLENTIAINAVLQDVDVVYYLAGNASPMDAERSISDHVQTNVLGAVRFFEQCVQNKVSKVISVSSGGMVYGPNAELPSQEASTTNPSNSYALAKVAIEQYLSLFDKRGDIQGFSLRVANPYGPYQLPRSGQGLIATVLDRLLSDKPVDIYGDGETIRDFVHISDVVEAMLQTGSYRGSQRVFNVGSGQGRSVNEVLESIETVLGRKIQITRHKARKIDISASILDGTRAKVELGWESKIKFEDGLHTAYQWMKSYHTASTIEPSPTSTLPTAGPIAGPIAGGA